MEGAVLPLVIEVPINKAVRVGHRNAHRRLPVHVLGFEVGAFFREKLDDLGESVK